MSSPSSKRYESLKSSKFLKINQLRYFYLKSQIRNLMISNFSSLADHLFSLMMVSFLISPFKLNAVLIALDCKDDVVKQKLSWENLDFILSINWTNPAASIEKHYYDQF